VTLVALDVLRSWEQGELPKTALSRTDEPSAQVASNFVAHVQKVAHWCSVVRWTDKRAAEILASVNCGKVEHASGGERISVGYYPKYARLAVSRASMPHAASGQRGSDAMQDE